jgi:16S rRNA (cytosine1402-N4)-methyltransferase
MPTYTQKRGGLTAADICNEFTQEELSRILKVYGDEPRARKISEAIVAARPLSTTSDLKNAVAKVTPEFAKKGRRMGRTATLARVFQSLRIVVNEEDVVLRNALEDMAPSCTRKGGRLVALTYHSMEDRAVKRVMRDGATDGRRQSSVSKDLYGNDIYDGGNGSNSPARPWKPLGKKQKATEEEIQVNSRARSATLRVAQRMK